MVVTDRGFITGVGYFQGTEKYSGREMSQMGFRVGHLGRMLHVFSLNYFTIIILKLQYIVWF